MIIPQMEPLYGNEEVEAICEYMRSGAWLTEYTKTAKLERMFCNYLGVEHCVMMPSGTMALYAALMALGIGFGDWVIVPTFTMIATPNAVRMANAFICFADIERETLCLGPEQVDYRASRRPGRVAVIYVSLNGRCSDIDGVREVCKKHNMWLIEDACQSLGSTYQGKPLGTFGDVGCFSLSCQKIISTGNGGFCVTNNDEIAKRLRLFKDFGREAGGSDNYTSFGVNLKYTDLQAVIGIEQLKKLPQRVERKKDIYSKYLTRLHRTRGVKFIQTDVEQTAPWFIDILAERRDELMAHLKHRGIQTRAFYPALHKTPVYRKEYGSWALPVSEEVAQRGLWLPSALTLTDDDIETVCTEIERFYQHG